MKSCRYIETFNPHLHIEGGSSDDVVLGIDLSIAACIYSLPNCQLYSSTIFFKNPEGNVFPFLIPSIREHIISFEHMPISAKEVCLNNYVLILLLVAARERVVEDEIARLIEKEARPLEPFAHMYHKQLDLFRNVARISAYLDIPSPVDLRDETKLWGQSIHRGIIRWGAPGCNESKRQRSKEFRGKGSILQRGGNPFQDDEPELKSLIQYALKLSRQQSESIREKEMRKDIIRSLEHLRKAYISLANYIQKEREIRYTTVINGRHYHVGINNHLTEVRHT